MFKFDRYWGILKKNPVWQLLDKNILATLISVLTEIWFFPQKRINRKNTYNNEKLDTTKYWQSYSIQPELISWIVSSVNWRVPTGTHKDTSKFFLKYTFFCFSLTLFIVFEASSKIQSWAPKVQRLLLLLCMNGRIFLVRNGCPKPKGENFEWFSSVALYYPKDKIGFCLIGFLQKHFWFLAT